MADLKALVEEGERLWAHYMRCEVTHDAMWSWFDLHHAALLAAARDYPALRAENEQLKKQVTYLQSESTKALMRYREEKKKLIDYIMKLRGSGWRWKRGWE